MAALYMFKCKGCGYEIEVSKDGDYTLMCGPGHFYICSKCKLIFTKSWGYGKVGINNDYSYEKDDNLAGLLIKSVPQELHEVFKKDIQWFQHEVIKGSESKYYGKTVTHEAVIWTKQTFWEKLFKFLERKDYSASIKIKDIKEAVASPYFERFAIYQYQSLHVRCKICNEIANPWSPSDGCPKCGNTMESNNKLVALVD